jgi:hypothetical protein
MNARCLTCSLLLLLAPLAAQEPAPAPQPPAAAAKPREPAPTVTLTFAGGPLADFVAQLRRAEPRANIVVEPAAATAVLPPLDLRATGLDQALDAACVVAASEHTIRMKDFRGSGEPVFTILAVRQPKGPEQVREGVRTEVFGLARLTEGRPDDDVVPHEWVLGAIEGAVGEPKLAALRLHRESNLLIVRGTGEQLDVAQSVLKNLERDLAERRQRRAPAQPPAEQPKTGK